MSGGTSIRLLAPSRSIASTAADGILLVLLSSGRLYVRIRRERRIAAGPSAVLVDLMTPHELRTDESSTGYMVEIHASDLELIRLVCQTVRPEILVDEKTALRIAPIPRMRFDELEAIIAPAVKTAGSPEIISEETRADFDRLTVAEFLVCLTPILSPESFGSRTDSSTSFANIEEIETYITENYAEAFTLSSLAGKCGLSPSYFARSFKRIHGQSVFEYLHRLRIGKACVLLKRSRKPVLEIAMEVGYNNISFFNRCFRRITGTTPVEYRRS